MCITGGDATGLGGDPAGGDAGGGVYVLNASAALRNNQVLSNTARWGGGLYLRESDATLSGNTITANTARWGGGLYLRESDATLANNFFADNQADIAGSGLHIQRSSPRLLHTTIVRNGSAGLTAGTGGDGSGIYVTGDYEGNYSTVALTNTILVSHTMAVTVTAGNTVTLEATLWGKDTWANTTDWGGAGTVITGTPAHNYWGDPAFVAPGTGDYHIGAESAALDAGVDTGVTTDVDGDPRPIGASYDVGADEFPAVLSVTQQASPNPVQAGAQLTYTIRVTNTGSVTLTATITDVLPDHVAPGGLRTWTPTIVACGGVWTETVVVTVEMGYAGPLSNVVQVTTGEGATGADTSTVAVAQELVTVGPSEGGIIVATSADGMTTTVEVPPGAMTEPTQLAYASVPTVTSSPPGFAFAGRAFRLEAYRHGALHSGLVFEEPVAVTIHYTRGAQPPPRDYLLPILLPEGGEKSLPPPGGGGTRQSRRSRSHGVPSAGAHCTTNPARRRSYARLWPPIGSPGDQPARREGPARQYPAAPAPLPGPYLGGGGADRALPGLRGGTDHDSSPGEAVCLLWLHKRAGRGQSTHVRAAGWFSAVQAKQAVGRRRHPQSATFRPGGIQDVVDWQEAGGSSQRAARYLRAVLGVRWGGGATMVAQKWNPNHLIGAGPQDDV